MTSQALPKTVNWIKLANAGVVIEGDIRISDLPRLASYAGHGNGKQEDVSLVTVNFQFDVDSQGLSTVSGTVKTEVVMQCQRCLEPVKSKLSIDTLLVILLEESEREIPEGIESFYVEHEHLLLGELIEEEVLLSIPVAAYHGDCKAYEYSSSKETEEIPKKDNPFKVLETLKGQVD